MDMKIYLFITGMETYSSCLILHFIKKTQNKLYKESNI